MADDAQDSMTKNGSRLQAVLAAFRHVGMPLLQSMAETPAAAGDAQAAKISPEQFGQLVDMTVLLSRELTGRLGVGEESLEPAARWALAGSASQVVAANLRATGHALTPEQAKVFGDIAAQIQEKFRSQIPASGPSLPNTAAVFRAQMMEAMVPVIGAVAQYAFGRAEHALLAEIAEQLVKTADQITRSLAPAGATPEQWRLLCWNILRSAGQIYTECHFAEADRLLYMNPDDRTAYFAKHNNVVPMTQVWQAFRQRMAMLATLAMYLDVPEGAQFEEQSWP
jgi:hypothetical protein